MTISKKASLAILQSLKWIKDNSMIAQDGSVNVAVSTSYFMAMETLVHHTSSPDSMPERTQRRAVSLAIRSWLNNRECCRDSDIVSTFLKVLEMERRRLEEEADVFNVLMFLNADESIRTLEPISILDDHLSVNSWNELSSLSIDDLWKEIQFSDRSNSIFLWVEDKPMPRSWDFLPIVLSTRSYGPEAAMTIANDRFDILRAILNISLLSGRTTFLAEPKQLAVFLPTPVLGVFRSTGALVSPYRTLHRYDYNDYRKATIKDNLSPETKSFLDLFGHETKYPSMNHHLLGILRLYQAAIDLSSTSFIFLGMWQVLEAAVTLGPEKIDQQKVVSRISTLVGMDPMFQQSITIAMELRNRLVHRGESIEEGNELTTILKLIADILISRLLGLAKKFSTIYELRDYLEYHALGNAEITRKMDVLGLIREIRSVRSVEPEGRRITDA